MVAFWAVGRRPRFLLLLATRRGFAPALVLLPATADQTSVFHVATQSIGSPRCEISVRFLNYYREASQRRKLSSELRRDGTSRSAPENAFADALGRNIGKDVVHAKKPVLLLPSAKIDR